MFAKTIDIGFAQRVVATLVACALVLLSVGIHSTAQAANLTTVSNTLTDSNPSTVSDHTIAFTVPALSAGVIAGGTIVVTFPAGFGMGSVAFGDIDMSIAGADQTLAAVAAGAVWGASVSGQVLTLTSGTGAVTAGQEVIILVGGSNKVNNSAVQGSHEFVVTAGADIGKTRVAIIDNVLVSAIVNTTFDFTITGLATSTAVNGTSTTGSTSPQIINFGVLTANQIKSLAQRLNVTTNARNGFTVTVQSDGDLESSNGASIDNFDDGSDVAVPGTVWNAPSPDINDRTTWGHWGLTSNDSDLAVPFGANEFIAASTSAREVFSHDGPSDGSTIDKGRSDVLYQVQITSLQEAADDYNTTLTYIATPTF